jgi:hypothetical protein
VRTTPFHRVAVMGIAALVVAGLASGCATKKTKSANAGSVSTSSSAAGASAPAATSAAPSETATPSTVKATGGGKFCQQVASAMNATAATSGGSNNMAATIKNSQALEAAVLKAAPNAIKSDLITVFGATDKLYAALVKANYDYTKVDPTAMSDLLSPAVKTAEQHLTDYAKNTCGIDLGGPAASSS